MQRVRLPPPREPSEFLTECISHGASDSAGNIILNPTTYNQPIIVTLNYLDSGAANVALSDVPPTGFGTPEPIVSTNGSSVQVVSPADVVTLSLIPTIPSNYFDGFYATIGYLSTSLASPPANFSSTNIGFVAEVVPSPSPTPSPIVTASPPPTPSPSPTGFITVIGS